MKLEGWIAVDNNDIWVGNSDRSDLIDQLSSNDELSAWFRENDAGVKILPCTITIPDESPSDRGEETK